jgi:hypothetical protein
MIDDIASNMGVYGHGERSSFSRDLRHPSSIFIPSLLSYTAYFASHITAWRFWIVRYLDAKLV